jgi:hypothetical protein
VQLAIDVTGGASYVELGTTQLLSVPYALYAEKSGTADVALTGGGGSGSVPQYTQAQIDALTPVAGMLVFNTDYELLQFYNGTQWSGSQSSGCVPQPNSANADGEYNGSKGKVFGSETNSVTIVANEPSFGISGKWEIISGVGGSVADITAPTTIFTGVLGNNYVLSWNLYSQCGDTSSTNVNVVLGMQEIDFNGALYVYPVDNSTGIQWYNGTYTVTGATSTTDGETNTAAIVANQGAGAYAAYICDTLTAFGYSDWYLPSKDELNAMYLQKDVIGGFTTDYYWSSAEGNNSYAWCQYFYSGYQNYYNKSTSIRVRCVRR